MGLKSEIEDRVKLNAAIFYIDYKDRLYTNQEITSAGLIAVTTNIGPSHNIGAEADAEAALGHGFKLSAGFGVTRAVWGNTPYIDPQTSGLINLDGKLAPFTPAYTGNFVLEWNHTLGSGYAFGARGDASFTGRSYWDPQDSAKQQAYHQVNLGAHVGRDAWTVSAHISNLTQTRFNTIYGPSYDVGIPLNVAHVNQPRETAVSVTVRF
jgi:outer membrane receptor protein involved in Fe transport